MTEHIKITVGDAQNWFAWPWTKCCVQIEYKSAPNCVLRFDFGLRLVVFCMFTMATAAILSLRPLMVRNFWHFALKMKITTSIANFMSSYVSVCVLTLRGHIISKDNILEPGSMSPKRKWNHTIYARYATGSTADELNKLRPIFYTASPNVPYNRFAWNAERTIHKIHKNHYYTH